MSSLTGAITVHPPLNDIVAETAWEVLDELPASARRGPPASASASASRK